MILTTPLPLTFWIWSAQVQRAAVTEMLRPLEEALIERKALLECICMPPVLNSHAAGCDAVIAALQGQASHLQGSALASWLCIMELKAWARSLWSTAGSTDHSKFLAGVSHLAVESQRLPACVRHM